MKSKARIVPTKIYPDKDLIGVKNEKNIDLCTVDFNRRDVVLLGHSLPLSISKAYSHKQHE